MARVTARHRAARHVLVGLDRPRPRAPALASPWRIARRPRPPRPTSPSPTAPTEIDPPRPAPRRLRRRRTGAAPGRRAPRAQASRPARRPRRRRRRRHRPRRRRRAQSLRADDGRCARLDSAADPMRLIDAVLDGLEKQGFVLGPRQRQTNLRGAACAISLQGGDPSFLYYQLQQTAEEGYVFVLVPTGPQSRADRTPRPRGRGARRPDRQRRPRAHRRRYRSGDSNIRLRKILGLEPGNLSPEAISAQLQQLGYRARFLADGAGELTVRSSPAAASAASASTATSRCPRRDVQRELSVAARPGALAHGACATPAPSAPTSAAPSAPPTTPPAPSGRPTRSSASSATCSTRATSAATPTSP
jgi:hypothetical protein